MSLSVHKSVHMCCQASHPFVGRACERIRQLQSWAEDRKATSFADLPFTGQPVRFQRGFVRSRLEKWTKYDSEADDYGDRHCSITGRYMFYPSTQPLCVNATLNYLVVSWYGEWGKVTSLKTKGQREPDSLRNPLGLPLFPLTLVWSCLIDIFLTGHDPGWESKVTAFKTLIRIAGRTLGAFGGHGRATPHGSIRGTKESLSSWLLWQTVWRV